MSDETTQASAKAEKPAAKAKPEAKAKAPEKPFAEVMEQDLIPALTTAMDKRGVSDLSVIYADKVLSGSFESGRRVFSVIFVEETLAGTKFFTCGSDGIPSSTVESFMIDERRVDVSLAVLYIVQRLFAQGWL